MICTAPEISSATKSKATCTTLWMVVQAAEAAWVMAVQMPETVSPIP